MVCSRMTRVCSCCACWTRPSLSRPEFQRSAGNPKPSWTHNGRAVMSPGFTHWLLPDDGQPFHNPVREGLPTTRPESLARCTPRKFGSPHVRLARYSAKWNPSCSESSKREFWHSARHGGFDEATDLSRILLFVFLGDSAENNLRIENETVKPV